MATVVCPVHVLAEPGGEVVPEGLAAASPVIHLYRTGLELLLPEAASLRLESVDIRQTDTASPRSIAFAAANSAVRSFAALALEAANEAQQAAALRRLPTIADPASASVALGRLRTIREWLASTNPSSLSPALEALLSAELATRQAMHATVGPQARPLEGSPRTARPVLHGQENESPTDAPAMVVRALLSAIGSAHDALRSGATEEALASAAAQSVREMATLGRQPSGRPPLPQLGPPSPSLPRVLPPRGMPTPLRPPMPTPSRMELPGRSS